MKVKDVPQDKDQNYEGHSKIRYARSEAGDFVKVPSTGCNIEKQATSCAWEDIRDSLKQTYSKVEAGELSPLAFHMENALLTPDLLASNVGVWTWTVKRHLRPKSFNKLTTVQLKKYADFLELSVIELKALPRNTDGK